MDCSSPRSRLPNHPSMGAALSRPNGSSSRNVASVIKSWSGKPPGLSIREAAADGASWSLVQSERIVSREWTVRGQAFRTDEIYRRDINNSGSLTRQPVQHVEIVQTTLSGGGLDTARTVSGRVGDR